MNYLKNREFCDSRRECMFIAYSTGIVQILKGLYVYPWHKTYNPFGI